MVVTKFSFCGFDIFLSAANNLSAVLVGNVCNTSRLQTLFNFRLYNNFKVPLNLYPTLPAFQLEFGQLNHLPFVRASSFGILGLDWDLLVLTDCICEGKAFCKAKITFPHEMTFRDTMINNNISNINFVTEFDCGNFWSLHSGHLEQLAIACPNLERLNLASNFGCLSSLRGLKTIVLICADST